MIRILTHMIDPERGRCMASITFGPVNMAGSCGPMSPPITGYGDTRAEAIVAALRQRDDWIEIIDLEEPQRRAFAVTKEGA